MYKLCFYVPESHVEKVKEAVFAAGGGIIDNYEKCAWETAGIGQYLPNVSSNPFLGSTNRLEKVNELKVEMVIDKKHIKPALQALLKAHPYETPAYSVWPVLTIDDF